MTDSGRSDTGEFCVPGVVFAEGTGVWDRILKLDEVGGIGTADLGAKGVMGFASLRLERVDNAGGSEL